MSALEADILSAAAAAAPAPAEASVPRQLRLTTWLWMTVVSDVFCAVLAGLVAARVRFGAEPTGTAHYTLLTAFLPVVWLALLAVSGTYDRRWVSTGAEPFRRVFNAGVALVAIAAIASFMFKAQLSREWVGVTALVITPVTLVSRYAGRKILHTLILEGRSIHRVLVAGSSREVTNLVRHVRRAPHTGFTVVAVSQLDSGPHLPTISDIPALDADLDELLDTAQRIGADTIAVAGSSSLPEGALRRLAWQLEGSDIQLVVAPAVSDFAGPRIVVRPVDGLPLLDIAQPDFAGMRRVAKDVLDRVLAAALTVTLSPVMLAIAIAIKLDDGGPVFFRQQRVGREGDLFRMWKFRTMHVDAEAVLPDLLALNDHDGVLFKMREDPRITRVGRFLRRHSLDELPQLFNVLPGEMSLVGPRPPLPAEVERFGDDMRRKLLVKPGMTGLWQINGRADLPWDESVRLDLQYVENWSVALDLMVLWKTLSVVRHGRGGY